MGVAGCTVSVGNERVCCSSVIVPSFLDRNRPGVAYYHVEPHCRFKEGCFSRASHGTGEVPFSSLLYDDGDQRREETNKEYPRIGKKIKVLAGQSHIS
jgi:hypothetical protein